MFSFYSNGRDILFKQNINKKYSPRALKSPSFVTCTRTSMYDYAIFFCVRNPIYSTLYRPTHATEKISSIDGLILVLIYLSFKNTTKHIRRPLHFQSRGNFFLSLFRCCCFACFFLWISTYVRSRL